MKATRRTILLKLAASTVPLAAGLSIIMKKAEEYRIVPRDTVSGIAKQRGITVPEIVRLNPWLQRDPNRIRPGQRLVLPTRPAVARPAPAVRTPVPASTLPPSVVRMNRISAQLHRKLNNRNLESAILANFNRETGGTFDYRQREIGTGAGYGIPQYTGTSLTAYRNWLANKKLKDSEANQIDYFCDVYMPSRVGHKEHLASGSTFTPEQQADWLHRKVFTPAHTIETHKDYSPAKINEHTTAHNAFMKNKLRQVNGVWEGVTS